MRLITTCKKKNNNNILIHEIENKKKEKKFQIKLNHTIFPVLIRFAVTVLLFCP